ncbi:hypothetical protein NXF25_018944 [Crotalus adamanteus]|uniref:Uncharacterized protein n=1 Tax=Crotalus adamanteus TaxID=8729 RepID=A0AAW1B188_CROAD
MAEYIREFCSLARRLRRWPECLLVYQFFYKVFIEFYKVGKG